MNDNFFIRLLTPKDTEEIKPGLFVQKRFRNIMLSDKTIGKETIGHRQVYPAAWNGKINWKNFMLGRGWSGVVWFVIILFIAYAYYHDVKEYNEFYLKVMTNPVEWCDKVNLLQSPIECTKDLQKKGLCTPVPTIKNNLSNIFITGS